MRATKEREEGKERRGGLVGLFRSDMWISLYTCAHVVIVVPDE